ncbi:MAG: 4Fe-4S dicluster domain-containing protein [Deltaproteobacteria bacterium]|nr:4Fe-4S dicluster domain-containing protein [Deltaproteobacteria bacterium]
MAFWTYSGLKFGIKSVKFPEKNDFYDGFIASVKMDAQRCLNQKDSAEKCRECEIICPTNAIGLDNLFKEESGGSKDKYEGINTERCIFCGLCIDVCRDVAGSGGIGAINYTADLDFDAFLSSASLPLREGRVEGGIKKKIFKKSLFVKHIDTGSCGACESEINALNNPYYNMHRLGIFITPSPRFADVLLATGTFTEQMSEVFFNVLDNIPKPRFIILAGSCTLFGGIFETKEAKEIGFNIGLLNSLETKEIFRNENIIVVPHCPPNPFEILNVLLLIKNGELK